MQLRQMVTSILKQRSFLVRKKNLNFKEKRRFIIKKHKGPWFMLNVKHEMFHISALLTIYLWQTVTFFSPHST
jgi:hypothetical protein